MLEAASRLFGAAEGGNHKKGVRMFSNLREKEAINDINVCSFRELIPPEEIKRRLPIPDDIQKMVAGFRRSIAHCMKGNDPRLLLIVGPCSIHDTDAGLVYAQRLAELSAKVADCFLIVMRVYFEKPRTSIGWKGFISDPHLDGSNAIEAGLLLAREFLLAVAAEGLPAATEFLDPIIPQYTADLVSWAAIGARTTESQTHREMASGLSMPVGFKNATSGSLQVALDAMAAARTPHSFLGIDGAGRTSIVTTVGNPHVHMILRGGGGRPNYDPADIRNAFDKLGCPAKAREIMVDCSHGNSNKDFRLQPLVLHNVVGQHLKGAPAILGFMMESFLKEGRQEFPSPAGLLASGVSITDSCLGWEATEETILSAYVKMGEKR